MSKPQIEAGPLQHQPHPASFTDAELLKVIQGYRDGSADVSAALMAQLILQNRGHR